jgi:hypothetical protein
MALGHLGNEMLTDESGFTEEIITVFVVSLISYLIIIILGLHTRWALSIISLILWCIAMLISYTSAPDQAPIETLVALGTIGALSLQIAFLCFGMSFFIALLLVAVIATGAGITCVVLMESVFQKTAGNYEDATGTGSSSEHTSRKEYDTSYGNYSRHYTNQRSSSKSENKSGRKEESYSRYDKRDSSQSSSANADGMTDSEKQAYYGTILELRGKTTPAEIKKKYRELIRKYHPDNVERLGDEFREMAHEKTKEINAAYEYFKRKYDIR